MFTERSLTPGVRRRLHAFVRLVTPLTRPGNRTALLASIPIAYVLTMKRVICFSDLPRCEQFLGRPGRGPQDLGDRCLRVRPRFFLKSQCPQLARATWAAAGISL